MSASIVEQHKLNIRKDIFWEVERHRRDRSYFKRHLEPILKIEKLQNKGGNLWCLITYSNVCNDVKKVEDVLQSRPLLPPLANEEDAQHFSAQAAVFVIVRR